MPRPRTKPVTVKVLWPNLWTSEGKFYRGDEVALPPDEADALDSADKVKIARPT